TRSPRPARSARTCSAPSWRRQGWPRPGWPGQLPARWRMLRRARAMIVFVGLCAPEVTNTDPSAAYTLSRPCTRPWASVTLVARVGPHHHAAHDVVAGGQAAAVEGGGHGQRHARAGLGHHRLQPRDPELLSHLL